MYFGLPSYTPPRLLGETGVRRHWSTKYILSLHYYTVFSHAHFTGYVRFLLNIPPQQRTPPSPCLGKRFEAC